MTKTININDITEKIPIWLAESSQELLGSQSTFIQTEISLKNEWLHDVFQVYPNAICVNLLQFCPSMLFFALLCFFLVLLP